MRAAWCLALAFAACHPAAEDAGTTRIVIASEPVQNVAPPPAAAPAPPAATQASTAAAVDTTDGATKAQAEDLYRRGQEDYNLGDFANAIEAFKAGYEVWPQPAFLFNIAQSYRQMGDAQNAIFFYKRFLEVAPSDSKVRPEVEDFIRQLGG